MCIYSSSWLHVYVLVSTCNIYQSISIIYVLLLELTCMFNYSSLSLISIIVLTLFSLQTKTRHHCFKVSTPLCKPAVLLLLPLVFWEGCFWLICCMKCQYFALQVILATLVLLNPEHSDRPLKIPVASFDTALAKLFQFFLAMTASAMGYY